MPESRWGGTLTALIKEGARALGIYLAGPATERLVLYGALLQEAGRRAGFRPADDARILVGKHLLDGATCLLATDYPRGATVVDVGSGVGLPGLVVAICRPGAQVVLVEPRGRRAGFLRWAVWQLELGNVRVVRARAEQLALAGERFQRVLARALAPYGVAARLCLPLAAAGGEFIAMLGPRGEEEAVAAGEETGKAGGVVKRVVRLDLPWGMGRRVLVVVGREQEE
ncbi:MAG: 16S rRNA (guanine(527)-N(7))-methyltransferase RsmG [Bacillota bacterium]|nr:16S rRNA (guanine(527)-N(7))-methyltransferase RsmG [Bacillota bacterium]